MTDELERRVRDALHRAPLPAAPETLRAELERLPTVSDPSIARRRPASAWLLGAAAAVILAISAIWLPHLPSTAATPTSSRSPNANGSPTPVPGGLVPWTDATPTPLPSPTPVVIPPGTRMCDPNDLTASAGWQGATGQMAGGVGVTNTSSTACVITGSPRQIELRAGATILKVTYRAMTGPDPGETVTTPGQSAYLKPGDQARTFVIWTNWCGATRPAVSAVLVTLANGGSPITARAAAPPELGIDGFPRCDEPSIGSTLSAWKFVVYPPQQPATEPLPASVSMSAPKSATAGQILDFTVTLTNQGAQSAPLEPCPTYMEDLVVGGRALKPPGYQDYLLNCQAIGPQIAAGSSVVLAMRYAIPANVDPGPVELGWSMDPGGPFDSLSASARVTLVIVGPSGPGDSSPP